MNALTPHPSIQTEVIGTTRINFTDEDYNNVGYLYIENGAWVSSPPLGGGGGSTGPTGASGSAGGPTGPTGQDGSVGPTGPTGTQTLEQTLAIGNTTGGYNIDATGDGVFATVLKAVQIEPLNPLIAKDVSFVDTNKVIIGGTGILGFAGDIVFQNNEGSGGTGVYIKFVPSGSQSNVLGYNSSTGEVVYQSAGSGGAGNTGPFKTLSYYLGATGYGQTGNEQYTLICDTYDSANSSGFTGYNPSNGIFTNNTGSKLGVTVDYQISSVQGNWSVELYKNSNSFWKNKQLGVFETNSYSHSLTLDDSDTLEVKYIISGPASYDVNPTDTKIQFTQLGY